MDLDLRGELLIGGVWVDATGNLLKRQSLTHTRGRQDLGTRTEPSTLRPLLNNTNGQFSFDNPRSVNYQKGGRNTPFRLSVAAGSTFLATAGGASDRATTPDHGSLDVTGDIDIRVEASLSTWLVGSTPTELAGKWGAAGNRSWMLTLWEDGLLLYWTADGTTELTAISTADLSDPPSGRMAVRATLDVNNGAGGRTATFYTADSISGPWVQLGNPVTVAATTSIFNSTASVDVGAVSTVTFGNPDARFHKFELRDGIDGTLVASPDFTAQTSGATSFVDGAGRTWTLSGNAALTNRHTRLHHELTAYPVRWHPSGKHIWVPAETRGILRRYGRSGKALDSTLRRRIPSYGPLAYWPMEDGENSTQAYSPIAGVAPLKLSRATWAQADSLPSSNPLPVLASSGSSLPMLYGPVPVPAAALTAWSVRWAYRLDTPNATARTFLRILTTGTVAEWYIQFSSGGTTVIGKDDDGATIFTQGIGTGSYLYGQWVEVDFQVIQDGGNIDWHIAWIDINGNRLGIDFTLAGTIGRPTAVASPPNGYSSDLDGMAIGHISVWGEATNAAWSGAFTAWSGETAGARMQRLTEEETLPLTVCGVLDEQTQVGPQRPAAVLSLLEEAANADGGILYEDREQLALRYRGRATMYNQTPALVLDYTSRGLADPMEPTGDDEGVVNDVEVQRIGGSRARAVLEEGALSVQAPPDGVGTGYDQSFPLSLHSDDQAEPIAYWLMWLGTYEGRRYPQVRVMVHRAGDLIDQILAVDVGDKIVIRNPPEWLPPGDIELIVQGYEEVFSSEFEWDIIFNCTPAQPWTVGVAGSSGTALPDEHFSWVDTDDGCELAEDLDTTETTVDVLTTVGEVWSSGGEDFPYDWRVGGEVMTVTAPGGLLSANPFFNTDTTSWSGSSASIARSTSVVHPHPRAVASLAITPAGGVAAVEARTDASGAGTVTAGNTYMISGWVYLTTSSSDIRPQAQWLDAGGSAISNSGGAQSVAAGVWTYLEEQVTAPASASQYRLAARLGGTPAASDVYYVWGMRLTRVKASAVHDLFGRTESSTWGTADSGQLWSNSGGVAANFNVTGGYGNHIQTTVNATRRSVVAAPHADFDLYVDVTTSATATGASLHGGPIARSADGSNFYMARLEFTTGNAVILSLRKRVAGVETELDTFTTRLVHAAGTFVRVRFQGSGTSLRARAWLATAHEPVEWQVEATDSDLTAAESIGVRSFSATGNTNVNPELRFDNFDLISPQTVTAVRSQNGIVKAHSAGADVRLADPTIVAL